MEEIITEIKEDECPQVLEDEKASEHDTAEGLTNGTKNEEEETEKVPECTNGELVQQDDQKTEKKRYFYSKDDLINLSKKPCARKRPSCLESFHNNSNGLWDPEKWMIYKHGGNIEDLPSFKQYPFKREIPDRESVKRKSGDPRERLKEESQDDIVLSPQRRSFGTGCHVSQNKSDVNVRPVRSESQTQPEEPAYRGNSGTTQRRVGTGRVAPRDRNDDWSDRSERNNYDRNYERDFRDEDNMRKGNRYGGGRFNDYDNRRNGGRRFHRDFRSEEEKEPEWFSGGPTSQHDTIELKGFDDNEEDNSHTGKCGSRPGSKNQKYSLEKIEHRPSSRGSGKGSSVQDISHEKSFNDEEMQPNIHKEETPEFDINEMLKAMDGWKEPNHNEENLIQLDISEANNSIETGRSRFARFFAESDKREMSPIDKLLFTPSSSAETSFNSSREVNEEAVSRVLNSIADPNGSVNKVNDPMMNPANSFLGHHQTENHSKIRNSEDQKHIFEILHKANSLNQSRLMQHHIQANHNSQMRINSMNQQHLNSLNHQHLSQMNAIHPHVPFEPNSFQPGFNEAAESKQPSKSSNTEEQKRLFEILQKANINVNRLMQQQQQNPLYVHSPQPQPQPSANVRPNSQHMSHMHPIHSKGLVDMPGNYYSSNIHDAGAPRPLVKTGNVEEQKRLFDILQKANINVTRFTQQQPHAVPVVNNTAIRGAALNQQPQHLGQMNVVHSLNSMDSRQMPPNAQSPSLHPAAFQQIFLKAAAANIQTHIQTHAAAAAAAAAAVSAAQVLRQQPGSAPQYSAVVGRSFRPDMNNSSPSIRMNSQQLEMARGIEDRLQQIRLEHNQMDSPHSSRQSPVNLTKWFGNEVLSQQLPEMPPVPIQKALLLEDIERQ